MVEGRQMRTIFDGAELASTIELPISPWDVDAPPKRFANWSISEILSADKPETDDHGPDLTSTGGVLINELPKPTLFDNKINQA